MGPAWCDVRHTVLSARRPAGRGYRVSPGPTAPFTGQPPGVDPGLRTAMCQCIWLASCGLRSRATSQPSRG